jgi:hypothetical protein
MAMTVGTVSVAFDGSVTKSGYAGEYFDDLVAEYEAAIVALGQPVPTDPAIVAPTYQSLAKAAIQAATALQYVIDHGQAKIPSATGGLQKTPNPNTAATATDGPGTDKFLSIV